MEIHMRSIIYLLAFITTSAVSGEQYLSWSTNTSGHTCYTASNASPHSSLNVLIHLYDINGQPYTNVNPTHTLNNAKLGSAFTIEPLKSARICTDHGSFNQGFGIVKSSLDAENILDQTPMLILNGHYFDWSVNAFSRIPVNNSQPF
jgi:hypothetical protein